MIATGVYDENSSGCVENAAGGLIGATNARNSMDCADIKVLDDVADWLIAIPIDASNLTDCAEDSAGELIAYIDTVISMNCTDK